MNLANTRHTARSMLLASVFTAFTVLPGAAFAAGEITVPVNRSTLLELQTPMTEVLIANPAIADVHAHNATHLTIVGKKIGHTNLRIFDKDGKVLREEEVVVSYDLPAIRKAIKNFLPDEGIGVELVGGSVALTGNVSSAASADKAVRIVKKFLYEVKDDDASNQGSGANSDNDLPKMGAAASSTGGPEDKDRKDTEPNILNLMQITSGQQVMLRVRVGEINRTALKELGIDLNVVTQASGTGLVGFGTGGGIASLVSKSSASDPDILPGQFLLPGGRTPTNTQGVLAGRWQPNGPNGNTVSGLLKALESDGLFKVLAEPNLVAVSGEEADFLAGGEIPIPVVQGSGGTTNITIEYKPFGVAVKFTPYVLTENRIRMTVQPEVSEISADTSVTISGTVVPGINTRRAKTTVELAPGESFMIAGLMKDQMKANISQLPGVKELPILGALFRSTEFQRNETELVIAVTPYVVDPMKGSDVKLPTDNFRPSSQMELFFYGALGSLSGHAQSISQTPGVEGPIGFMVD